MSHAHSIGNLRPVVDGRDTWQQYASIARIGLLAFVTIGTALLREPAGADWLLVIYASWFALSIRHLALLHFGHRPADRQLWLQVALDFAVVAITVAVTHGAQSYFTFIFVMVIVEAGLLLGMTEGFLVATGASTFMLSIFLYGPARPERLAGAPTSLRDLEQLYNFLILCLGFYLTAFVSGYWHQRLNRMERFQRDILENLNSGFLIADDKGVVLVQNSAADQVLGFRPGAAIGLPVDEVMRSNNGGECPIRTVLRTGRDYSSYEFRVQTGDGATRLIGLTTNRMRDPNGHANGIIASFTDITAIHQMREEIRKQDRLAVVGELAAGLAHEIRNPVAVIRGAVDELQSVVQTNPLGHKLYQIALRESDHLNEIVTGFLDFAREPSVRRETFDVCELIDDVVETILREYDNDHPIEWNRPDRVKPISGDASQLRQVFINLAKNGIEAMEPDGGVLRITADNSDGPVAIRFEDEGPGIDPDKMTHIFEPFYTTKPTGVGMGLAVCMRILTAHDGTLHPSRSARGGCTMTVTLPAAKIASEVEVLV